jgi:CHAT domain-containing protein
VADRYGAGTRVLTGPEATRRSFLDLAPAVEVLHLATHGVLDRENPLDSKLLLAEDERAPEAESWVAARDLLSLDLSNVRVAVLSACGSATGPTSASEGPVSLTWPLLVRGVPAVVATLWRVDDRASSALTARFHEHYQVAPDACASLRQTQIAALRSDRLPAVRDWAAFECFVSGSARSNLGLGDQIPIRDPASALLGVTNT